MQLRQKAWKNSGLQRGLNPWPRDTGAMLYQLSYDESRKRRLLLQTMESAAVIISSN